MSTILTQEEIPGSKADNKKNKKIKNFVQRPYICLSALAFYDYEI